MNELTTFQFQPEGMKIAHPIRTVTIDGDPWFVAKDVCDVLGVVNNRDAISRLDGDEKNTVAFTDGNRGNPNVNVISESGLYALVLTSNKPEAKDFSRWVRKTVLPTIRKTGSYVKGEEVLDPNAPDYLDRLKDLMLAAQERKIAAAEAKIADLAPKAEALERLSASEGSLPISDAARTLGKADRTFRNWLRENGWIFLAKGRANGNRPVPYADKRKAGLMEVVTGTVWRHGEEIAVQSTFITPKGLAHLAEAFGRA